MKQYFDHVYSCMNIQAQCVFVSQLICYALVCLKSFCAEDLFWLQNYWVRDILLLLLGNYMVVIHILCKKITSPSHKCRRVCSPMTDFQLIVNRDGCHMWGRKCSLFSGTLDFTPYWEVHDFTHSLYSKTCDEGTPQKVSLHDRCPLVTGTFQC